MSETVIKRHSLLETYSVHPFTESLSQHLKTTDRLSVLFWKETAKMKEAGIKPLPKIAVVLPSEVIACVPEIFSQAATSYFWSLQDEVLRSQVEDFVEEYGAEEILQFTPDPTALLPEMISSYAVSDKRGTGRLTKDAAENWFDVELASKLFARLSNVPGVSSDRAKLAVKQHREAISQLAASKSKISEKLATQLKKAIALVDGSDMVKMKLDSKLDSIIAASRNVDEFLSL